MAKKFRLNQPGVAEEVRRRLRQAAGPREQQRLLALKLALSGEFTLEQIGKAVDRSRATVADWMRLVRDGQLDLMLGRHQGRGRKASLKPRAIKELRRGLMRGRWTRAKDAQIWLANRHRVKMGLKGVRYWLKKHSGVMRVPRRSHARQDPAAFEEFKRTLARRLWRLKVPRERPVRVWIMDEHRYGLISHGRRCWTLRGVRPRARYRTRYEWGYVGHGPGDRRTR
jgi:transposase